MLRSNRVLPYDSVPPSKNKTSPLVQIINYDKDVPGKNKSDDTTVIESSESTSPTYTSNLNSNFPARSILKRSTDANRNDASGQPSESKKRLLSSINLIDFSSFETMGKIPKYSVNKHLTINLDYINRENAFIIFISHNWLRSEVNTEGWDGTPNPDNSSSDKYRLIVQGVKRLWKSVAPRMSNCYIWIDYSCFDEDLITNKKSTTQLHSIMSCSDCMFTPVVDTNHSMWEYPSDGFSDLYKEYPSPSWRADRYGYMNRSWCRLEMFYAINIPVNPYDPNRHDKFVTEFKSLILNGIRPHFLYGSKEMSCEADLFVLPPLSNSMLTDLDPTLGHCTAEEDEPVIEALLVDLLPYITPHKLGYTGQRNVTNQMQGKGVFRAPNGDVYCGDFEKDMAHGHGVYRYANGCVYEGDFVNDIQHGSGVYRFANGSIYTGDFQNDVIQGRGVYRFANGDVYEGEYQNDLKHGKGTYCYASGNVYEGDWVQGRKNGKGVFLYNTGAKYEGDFRDDNYHGKGALTYPDGRVFEGDFKYGVRDGQGSIKYNNGNVFWSEYKNDKQHGKAVMRYRSGKLDETMWIEGRKVTK